MLPQLENRRQNKLRQAQGFLKFRGDIKIVALATIKMSPNLWMKVINSENPPMKLIDNRFSEDIYWALTSALKDDHKYATISEFCDTAQNGDGDGYSAWHALVRSSQ